MKKISKNNGFKPGDLVKIISGSMYPFGTPALILSGPYREKWDTDDTYYLLVNNNVHLFYFHILEKISEANEYNV